MNKNFLAGVNDYLIRYKVKGSKKTFITSDLQNKLIEKAIRESLIFFEDFFDTNIHDESKVNVSEYLHALRHALSLNLFAEGGIKVKDHLNFWCISKAFQPETYIESGVFIGSSLHAFVNANQVNKIICIDPNFDNLRIPNDNLTNCELISHKDFSELEILCDSQNTLAYFDDHINAASRIIESHKKGIKYLLFDDSQGFEGICQRKYPAIPTIPMILNYDVFVHGDQIIWPYKKIYNQNRFSKLKRIFTNKEESREESYLNDLTISNKLIEQCKEAYKLIERCSKIPDLGDYIPQSRPGKTRDTTKFIIELK